MHTVRREIWREPESQQFWGLEFFDREVIGCVGPFHDTTQFPASLDAMAFERNPDLLRWLGWRHGPGAVQRRAA